MERPSNSVPDLKPFEYQVAGHDAKSISGNIGILKHKSDGYLLKPINKSPQGEVEINFYERLNHDQDLLPIKKFIPDYLGFINLKLNDTDVRFLKLKDVTNGLVKPCVMDVKIGKKTWDPNASVQKRLLEDAKYVGSKNEFGFCIPGYMVFNIATGTVDRLGKEDGKKLDRDMTFSAFKHFFNLPSKNSQIVIRRILEELNELLEWWNIQRLVHIYASSVLLTYDAEKLLKLEKDNTPGRVDEVRNWVNVYMIDFAHVFPANDTQDCNYISGISKLIEVLNTLL